MTWWLADVEVSRSRNGSWVACDANVNPAWAIAVCFWCVQHHASSVNDDMSPEPGFPPCFALEAACQARLLQLSKLLSLSRGSRTARWSRPTGLQACQSAVRRLQTFARWDDQGLWTCWCCAQGSGLRDDSSTSFCSVASHLHSSRSWWLPCCEVELRERRDERGPSRCFPWLDGRAAASTSEEVSATRSHGNGDEFPCHRHFRGCPPDG